jgi:hypothetical protein
MDERTATSNIAYLDDKKQLKINKLKRAAAEVDRQGLKTHLSRAPR